MSKVNIEFKLLHELAQAPKYAHDGDAGADLVCIEDVTLGPGERSLVSTGVAIALPAGYVGLVHPRSGLATKHGIGIVNTPGTIDSGYRGELKICLINLDPSQTVNLPAGSRIAQLVIQEVTSAQFIQVQDLGETERNDKGFGSTGVSS
ncbi:MAG: dUTP diphosphatase [Candidatus Nanopelagicales bacterium]|nr:dUTP diphosphatase [Candidatus Nanopelagicales bacterium]